MTRRTTNKISHSDQPRHSWTNNTKGVLKVTDDGIGSVETENAGYKLESPLQQVYPEFDAIMLFTILL